MVEISLASPGAVGLMLTAGFWLTATVLMYLAGTTVLGDRRLGALAAALFPLTPLLV